MKMIRIEKFFYFLSFFSRIMVVLNNKYVGSLIFNQ